MSTARDFVRFDVKRDILINGRINAKVLDISKAGMFIHSHILFPVGTVVTLDLSLQDADPLIQIKTKAKVQHVKKGVGIGVCYQDIPEEMLTRIKFFVDNSCNKPTDCRKQILIIEESALARAMFRSNIELKGFDVREAADNREALKHIAHSIPDLVLLDLHIDSSDGVEFLKAIRAEERLKNLKVVVLISTTEPDMKERLSPYNILSFLTKITTTPKKLAEDLAAYLD